ncbi:MAG: carboxypeptidase regulatory-like domain-containing protein, partial [Planctomycetes bacterium]|nr:carboxypeptidase regulatory-like domain-containing protein [Planctomycetota bacterium]
MRRNVCWLAGWLLSALSAQDITTIGTVVDGDGRPLVAATVTFATSPADTFDALAPTEIVEAVTDAAGRFRVKLRAGREHSAWAIGPHEQAGRWRSEVCEGVVAGNVIELRAARRSLQQPIRLTPAPELGPGPFTIEVFGPARHARVVRVPLAADGTATLPEMPIGVHMGTVCRLLDAGGRVVVGWFWPNGDRTATAAVRRCAVEVVDEQGKPVAGAHVAALVSWNVGGSGFLLGPRRIDSQIEGPRTDADGRTVVVIADRWIQGFVAWTPDRFARLARRQPQEIRDGELLQVFQDFPGDDVPIQLILRSVPVLHGTLRRGALPLGGREVVASVAGACCMVGEHGAGSSGFYATHRGVTDAAGAFTIDGVARPIAALRLGIETGDEVPTFLLPRADVPAEAIDIDLASWPITTLQLRTDAALPPVAARFLLWPADPGRDGEPLVLVADRAGRTKVRLEPGTWFVFATDADGHAAELVTVQAGADRV